MIRLHQLAAGLVAVALVCSANSHLLAAEVLRYSFDDALVGTTTDSSVNGYDGNITGSLSSIAGVFGGAANFGTAAQAGSGRVNVPVLSNANFPTSNATMGVWFRDHSTNTNDGFLNFGAGSNSHHTWGSGNDGYFNIFRNPRVNNIQYEPVVAGFDPTNWHHLAIVNDVDNNEYSVYIDGVLAKQPNNVTDAVFGTTAFNLGQRQIGLNASGQWLDADLDEFVLFDEALTPEQIGNLMEFNDASGAPAAVPEPASILVWLMAGLAIGVTAWRRRNKS